MSIHREYIVAFVAFCLGAASSVGFMTLTNQARPAPIMIVPPEPTALPEATATPGLLRVYVNGAVRETAVYELPPDSLVQQAIEAAGGFTEEANTVFINLAQPLSDGLQIYVPAQGEEVPAVSLPASVPAAPVANTTNVSETNGVININSASKAELETLPGIGPTTAQNILDHRDANGPFQTIESIMDVTGIGEGRFSQIKELITVGN